MYLENNLQYNLIITVNNCLFDTLAELKQLGEKTKKKKKKMNYLLDTCISWMLIFNIMYVLTIIFLQ